MDMEASVVSWQHNSELKWPKAMAWMIASWRGQLDEDGFGAMRGTSKTQSGNRIYASTTTLDFAGHWILRKLLLVIVYAEVVVK